MTLGYSAIRIGDVVADLFGGRADGWEALAWLCADLGTALTLTGWFLPTAALATSTLCKHVHHRRLQPLWSAMHAVIPTIALEPSLTTPTGLRLGAHDMGWHLYRRAVEIRDGQLCAHPCPSGRRSAETRWRTAGLSEPDFAAAVTADQISHALAAMAQGRPPVTPPADYAETHSATGTPADDVRALLRIAARFTPLPSAPVLSREPQ